MQGALQALFGLPKLAFEGVLVGHQPLGGGGRGGGAHVGGEIRQGDIHLMAHGRHHRQTGVEDGPGQVLVVECPQVFQAAAASGDQHRILGGVEPRLAVEQRQGRDHRRGCFCALNRHGNQRHVGQWPARCQHRQHIADGGAAGGAQNQQLAGRKGQGAGVGKYPFAFQLRLQALVGCQQFAQPRRLHGVGDQLVIATGLEQRDPAAQLDLVAIAHGGRYEPRPLAKQRAAHLGAVIFQREVDMPGRRARHVGKLAFHPHIAQVVLQRLARLEVELTDR